MQGWWDKPSDDLFVGEKEAAGGQSIPNALEHSASPQKTPHISGEQRAEVVSQRSTTLS